MKQQTLKKYYTYLFFDLSEQEYIYVGKGTVHNNRMPKRPSIHLRRSDKHPFTQRLQKMKRDNVEPVVTFTFSDNEMTALYIEGFWERTIGRKNIGAGPLLNLKPCGEIGGAGPRSKNVIDKIKAALDARPDNFYETYADTHKAACKESNKIQVTCPHCNKTGGRSPMMRWHFDRCKHKP